MKKNWKFAILERDGFCCLYCGRKPPEVVLHVDHVIPLAEGGSGLPSNLATSCNECNIIKKDRLIAIPPQVIAALEKPTALTEKQLERLDKAGRRKTNMLNLHPSVADSVKKWSGPHETRANFIKLAIAREIEWRKAHPNDREFWRFGSLSSPTTERGEVRGRMLTSLTDPEEKPVFAYSPVRRLTSL